MQLIMGVADQMRDVYLVSSAFQPEDTCLGQLKPIVMAHDMVHNQNDKHHGQRTLCWTLPCLVCLLLQRRKVHQRRQDHLHCIS
jgi:hypothetical protein